MRLRNFAFALCCYILCRNNADREDDERIDMSLVHQIVNEVANEKNDGVDGLRGLFNTL